MSRLLPLLLLAFAAPSAWAQAFPGCPAGIPFPYTDKPLSVVFIIDNSGSMNDTDPNENRFKLAITLLDSLHRFAPRAEAGLVVYTRRLMFDWRENAFFKPAFPGDTVQCDSYVPLTGLRDSVGGKPGVDTLKALLSHDMSGELVHVTRLPAVRGSPNAGWNANKFNTRDGTDITLGFDAARLAMKSAKSPPSDRIFILLSDGEPTLVDSIRQARMMDFIKGDSCPTTHLVWFSHNPVLPANIATMLGNIRANGYSDRNPASKDHNASPQPPDSLVGGLLKGLLVCHPLAPVSLKHPKNRGVALASRPGLAWTALGQPVSGRVRGILVRGTPRKPGSQP